MNGKSVKKLLMQGRTRSFWGRRAYFKVRIPLSAFPEPCPPMPDLGTPGNCMGHFERVEDGRTVLTILGKIQGGRPPEADEPHKIYRLTRHGEGEYPWYSWWTAIEHRYEGILTLDNAATLPRTTRDIDPSLLEAYWKRIGWEETYLGERETGIPALDALLDAASWAKTTYPEVRGDYAYIVYSVKWFYPEHKLGFSRDMARAFRAAKTHNFPVRALPAFGY